MIPPAGFEQWTCGLAREHLAFRSLSRKGNQREILRDKVLEVIVGPGGIS